MDVRNCRNCGRLFNYFGGQPICQACKEELEVKYQQVKEYLRENPNSSIQKVSEDNEVSTKQITQWVREERLTFSDDSPVGIACEGCGANIKTGRYCEQCKSKMKNDFRSVLQSNSKPVEPVKRTSERDKMRFL